MKQIFSTATFVVVSTLGFSQTNDARCRSDYYHDLHLQQHPESAEEREQMEAYTADFVANYNPQEKSNIKTIPVVFHVNDPTNPQKVTLDQVQSALDIVNEDFRAMNATINNIRPEFQSVIADMEVEFCLASIDPNGNPTNGITYHYNNFNGVEPNGTGSAVKSEAYWPADQYLNIWIVNYVFDDGSLYGSGWAYLPDTWVADNNVDGIVYNHRYLGYTGSSEVSGPGSWQAHMAHVLTHECGHYLNLHHTFYNYCDEPGDYVDDTPYVFYHGSNNCDQIGTLCSSTTVIMDQNYMDYTPCPSMYSLGQKARVQAALNSSVAGRNNLWSESNLIATGCLANTTGIAELDALNRTALYPNPASNQIELEFDLDDSRDVNISIQNAVGQRVYSEITFVETGEIKSLDVATLPTGVYFVHLQLGEYHMTKRFVKE